MLSLLFRISTVVLLILPDAIDAVQPAITHFSQPTTYSIDPAALPAPFATNDTTAFPTIIAQPANATLTVPVGFTVNVFSNGVDQGVNFTSPRNMLLAPNGDILLADFGGNALYILRDENKTGTASRVFTFTTDLSDPFGMAFYNEWLYVANSNSIVRFKYTPGQTVAAGAPETILSNLTSYIHGFHLTRNILFSVDKTKLYIAIGSSDNIVIETDPHRAAISTCNPDGSNYTVWASGLRNPVGLVRNPTTGKIWTCVNERDDLGDELVPDYVTSVEEGGFYGWPYSYIGKYPDPRIAQNRSDLVDRAIVPDVLLASHSAPLNIQFYDGQSFPAEYNGDAFVTSHGSWNRLQSTGFKVVRIRFRDGKAIANQYEDFVTGWLQDATSNKAWGRPVGLLVLSDGSLLISDDGAAKVWRVSYCGPYC